MVSHYSQTTDNACLEVPQLGLYYAVDQGRLVSHAVVYKDSMAYGRVGQRKRMTELLIKPVPKYATENVIVFEDQQAAFSHDIVEFHAA